MKKLFTLVLFVSIIIGAKAQTVFLEDFEGGVFPATWSQETAASDGGWLVGEAGDLESLSFPIEDHSRMIVTNDDLCDCDKGNDFLKSPSFDLTGYDAPYMQFDLYYFEGTYDATENLQVEISSDGGTSWEVLSDLGYETASWRTEFVSLGDYAGMTGLMIGFRYDDGGGWLFGAGLDNISVFEADLSVVDVAVTGANLGSNIDVIPTIMNGYSNYLADEDMIVNGVITNNAFVVITSFDVMYERGTDVYTKSFSGLSLGAGSTYTFILDEAPLLIKAGDNDVTVTVSNINGGVSEEPAGNTMTTNINGVTPVAGTMVVGEEATGTWCGWCPRGAVIMDYMTEKYADHFIPIAVHNSDPMTDDDYDGDLAGLGILGYPSGLINRQAFIDPLEFESAFMDAVANDPGVHVTPSFYIDENRNITVKTTLNFTDDLDGDYRISVVFTEDEVTGTGGTWGQVNYYSGGGVGLMGGYEDLPATVPAADMVYQHVARGIANGFDGDGGSVPATNASGSVHEYSTTWEINEDYNIENMYAISLLIDHDNDEIINAGSVRLSAVNSIENISSTKVSIYPNPAKEVTYTSLSFSKPTNVVMQVIDMNGKIVAERNYGSLDGDQILPINTMNFSAGIYQIQVIAGDETITKKLMVLK
ncbi:MAG: T9SS type A sorting domain-containing protein [Chitinophagales bacterium]|nr:T9SS type A sorting domain-containing protein [Chitinophagales bacterium]